MTVLRRTLATAAVVDTLLRPDFPQEFHAYGLCRELSFHTGVVVPILQRLEGHGLITSWIEDQADVVGRRRRRYYRLTGDGREELARWQARASKGVPL